MNNRILILSAQVFSVLFSPFYLPVVAFVALLWFSYLNLLPLGYKVVLLLMVYAFTVVLPRLAIYIYRKINGWTRHELGRRERRVVPYMLSIISYSALLQLMQYLHMPAYGRSIIWGALILQVVCAFINPFLKISTHAAAMGGIIGALIAFSQHYAFDPTGWLCLCVLLSGCVCSSRLILRQHTLSDVGWGTLVGLICGFVCVFIN